MFAQIPLRASLGCFFAASLLFAPLASAQGTRLWTQSELSQLEKGTPDGVELSSDGQLRPGAGVTLLTTTASSFVWSLAADRAGSVYLGTGSPASILRVDPKHPEKSFTLFESKEVSVQALRLGPDGSLYAALLPSGRVYRLNPAAASKLDDSSATLVFDPAALAAHDSAQVKKSGASHYVWDLTFDAKGRLLIATGNPAAIYRVDPAKIDVAKPNAAVEEFFRSDEAHIRSLAWDAAGNLIAGTDGSGLVYRIDPRGRGYVLFEAPQREITSVAVGADGTIYAACAGSKSRIPLPPLAVQGVVSAAMLTMIQPGSLQVAGASASVPDGSELYALSEGRAPRRLWAAKDQMIYALQSRADGLLALTGNQGRILLIHPDGSFADVAHLDAQQVLSSASAGETLYLGTGNSGRLFSFASTARHEYASQIFDAGALARFGHVEFEPGAKNVELVTRSGNVEQPVRGWSDWSPLKDGVVASPAGRYLQWKAILRDKAQLGSVGVNYLPVNAAPFVGELVVVPGARFNASAVAGNAAQTISVGFASAAPAPVATADAASNAPIPASKDHAAVAARWSAHDDNGDELSYAVYLRGDGETLWRLLKENLTEKSFSFDATQIPDGGYQLKVVASDAPSHTPADALTAEKISARFEIDTTPPVVTNLTAVRRAANGKPTLAVRFEGEDASSPIARAEYSLDAGPWQYIEPVGKLSDARRETYAFSVELSAGSAQEHLLTVRVYDRKENVGLVKRVVSAEAQ